MNSTLRRAALILGFVGLVIVFGFLIWYIFFRPSGTLVTNNGRVGNINGLPLPQNGNVNRARPGQDVNSLPLVNTTAPEPSTIANGGSTYVTPVTTTPASGLTVNPDGGNLQYYDRETGMFYSLNPDGTTKTPLSDAVYKDVQNITWAPNGKQAILGFPDGAKILYDFTNKRQTTMPSELDDFSFAPQSDQIASKYLDNRDPENQWLVVSKPDGTQPQTAEHLGANADKVTVSWSPNNQIIGMYAKGSGTDQTDLVFLGANDENFPSVTVYGRGFIPSWGPDGRSLLYSIYSPLTSDNPHLYLMNGSPDNLGSNNLDLNLDTRADKCTFSSSGYSIYCAVPYYLNAGSGPQPELSADIPDRIYRIDIRSGTTSLIALPVDDKKAMRYSATNLQVTSDESALFFTDATTGTVQRVQLR